MCHHTNVQVRHHWWHRVLRTNVQVRHDDDVRRGVFVVRQMVGRHLQLTASHATVYRIR